MNICDRSRSVQHAKVSVISRYTALFLLSSLLLILSCNQAGALSDIATFTINYGFGSCTDADLKYLASHYKIIVTHDKDHPEAVQKLHQFNPEVKVLAYVNGTVASKSSNDWNDISTYHPDWFLQDAKGNRIFERDWADNYVLDPANDGWRAYRAQQLKTLVDDSSIAGFDGVFLDVMQAWIVGSDGYCYYNSHPIKPSTDPQREYDNREWQAAIADFLTVMKKAVGSNKMLIFNGIGTGDKYFTYDYHSFLERTDGALIEGFTRWGSRPISEFKSEELWKKDVDAVADIAAMGKTAVIMSDVWPQVTASATDIERAHLYSLSSYLLGADGEAYYDFRRKSQQELKPQIYNKLWAASIGAPRAVYYKQDNLYQRDFANGKVIVNPSDTGRSYTISLGNCYLTPDGRTVNKITLAPKTGTVLTRVRRSNQVSYAYNDVETDFWAYPSITELSQQGVVSGYADHTFRPTAGVTRAEFAKMLVLAIGWDGTTSSASSFSDVSKNSWAFSFVETAVEHGVIEGYSDNSFRPNQKITRAEIAKIMALAKGYEPVSTDAFSDITTCWAKEYISACAGMSLMNGYPDGLFKPLTTATRAEVAKMLAILEAV